jgi:hypothetical protein
MILLFVLPHVAGMTRYAITPSFYWLRWSLANFLPRLALNSDPPDLCLPSSHNYYRLEPLYLAYGDHFY